ncbi:vascular endothelial growth factor B isoform X15 [Pteropus medius]|uniref:vascular endothelial growth factor B isoform X15 n=1 Tax=Pteropus vampyrus TaxID=132908 RepID=UPI00196B0031|nr:vascular endothelial growth factor B isoform X15 [Pteropus giganteus]
MSPLLRRLLLAALLQLAPAQVSSLLQAPVSQPDAPGHQKKVVSWIDVYARATCQPREVVVPLTVELMGTVAKQLVPSCVTVQRCGGCCPDDGLECVPTGQHQVRMQILMIRYPSSQLGEMSLEEHSQCECRPKKKESAVKPDRSKVSLPVGEEPGKGKLLNVLNKYLPSVCWHWDPHKQGLHSNAGVQHKDI